MTDDLNADITAALREVMGGPEDDAPPAPVEQGAGGETDAAEPADVERAEADDADAPPEGAPGERGRDEKGRFAPKAAAPGDAAPKPETDGADGKAKPMQPPSHWSVEAKADFLKAPLAIQREALKREEEIEAARKDWAGKAEEFNRLDKVIGQHRDRWMRDGKSPDLAIAQLLAAEKALQSDPIGGVNYLLQNYARGNEVDVLAEIANAYGLQLVQADNQGQEPTGHATAQADPTVRRLMEQVQELSHQMTARERAEQASQREATARDIAAAFADPAMPYAENLRKEIAALVSIGDQAGDQRPVRERIRDAYEQAVWANPTTRALVVADQRRAEEEAARVKAARHAAGARKASGSITGSPGTGAAASRPSAGSMSKPYGDDLEADIRAALDAGRA